MCSIRQARGQVRYGLCMQLFNSLVHLDRSGEEIDLILERGSRRLAFEFKASVAPKVSRGFYGTLELLELEQVWIVAPVQEAYDKHPRVKVSPIREVLEDLAQLS